MLNSVINKIRPYTNEREPRVWQKNAIRHYFALLVRWFLLTATPGSGKSEVTCRIVRRLFLEGKIERVVVVVPTEQLKRQWAENFARHGIDIDPEWSNSQHREAGDYLGVAVTYAQVSAEPELYDFNCLQCPTGGVFDETHHPADGLDWGDKLRTGFSNAKYVVSLSGTPFRSDNNSIPFVTYENGKSQSNFSYGYAEALADLVCRPVFFSTIEGNATWIRHTGEEVTHSMLDDLSPEKSAELLRVLLAPEGEWLPFILQQADDKLSEFRMAGHPDAGGLVIAKDQFHARQIGKLLQKITGEAPVVVISDECEATRMIHEFGRPGNRRRWVVAVKMICEGSDIPRLRVGVFATNILSELFFRQAVGRVIRMIAGLDEQTAAFYLPAHPVLIRYALAIKEERDHSLARSISKNQPAAGSGVVGVEDTNQIDFNLSDDTGAPDAFGDYPEGEDTDLWGDSCLKDESGEWNQPGQSEDMGLDNSASDTGSSHLPIGSRRPLFVISTEGRFHDTIFDGMSLSDQDLKQAEEIGKSVGLPNQKEMVAVIIQRARAAGMIDFGNQQSAVDTNEHSGNGRSLQDSPPPRNTPAAPAPDENIPILSERKRRLRSSINDLVNKLAHHSGTRHEELHREWKQQMGGRGNGEATEDELLRKLEWIKNKIATFNSGGVKANGGR
jgi:superfamily II DNA or RNA helicase